jgi:hypothetical protein
MVSRRDREKMLRFIVNDCRSRSKDTFVPSASYFEKLELKDSLSTFHVLIAMGYITDANPNTCDNTKLLTPSGKCYFENKSDMRRDFWHHSILVPIGITIATTLIIQYVVPWIAKLLTASPPVQP